MNNEKIREFYTHLSDNESFKKELTAAKEKYEYIEDPEEKFLRIVNEVVMPRAKEKGLTFSAEDFLAYEKRATEDGELDLDALEDVSGGFGGFINICLSALMTLSSLAGTGSALLSTVSEAADKISKPISSFSETLKSKKDNATDTTSVTVKKSTETKKEAPSVEKHTALEKATETGGLDTDNRADLPNSSDGMSDEIEENEDMAESEDHAREVMDTFDGDITDSATAENKETPPPLPPRDIPTAPAFNTPTPVEAESGSASSGQSGLLAQIQKGVQLRHVEDTAQTKDSSSDLMAQIRAGKKLKPAQQRADTERAQEITKADAATPHGGLMDEIRAVGGTAGLKKTDKSAIEQRDKEKMETTKKSKANPLAEAMLKKIVEKGLAQSDDSENTNSDIEDSEWDD